MTEADWIKGTAELLVRQAKEAGAEDEVYEIAMPAVDAMELGVRMLFFVREYEILVKELDDYQL